VLAVSGIALIGAEGWWRVALYIALFGTAFGAVLPMRAVVMSRYFGGPLYGRLMGVQQMILALSLAGGPALAGLLRDTTGGYGLVWIFAAVLFVAATPVMLAVSLDRG
jgi:MFS family permease